MGLSRHGCVGLRDSHFPIQFTFLDHAFMGLVGAFDPVLELVVFDRHKLRDLINPNRAMPAGEYVVHTLADFEFVSGQFVLHARPVRYRGHFLGGSRVLADEFAGLTGFFPRREVNARLFGGKARRGPQFPTIPVGCLEAMRHFHMQLGSAVRRPPRRLVASANAARNRVGAQSGALSHRRLTEIAVGDVSRYALFPCLTEQDGSFFQTVDDPP
jgi:hypothetical protein